MYCIGLGIDGPVTTHNTPAEHSVGGLLVNVGSEEEEPPPRTKVSAIKISLVLTCILCTNNPFL